MRMLVVCTVLIGLAGCASPRGEQARARWAIEPNPEQQNRAAEYAAAARPPAVRPVQYESEIVGHAVETPAAEYPLFAGPTSAEVLIQYATTNNPKIAAARSKASAALARVPQARALEDPMLFTSVFLEAIQTAAGPQDLFLGLSQKFPWFGKRRAREQVAFYDAQVACAEMAAIELAVIEEVRLAYLDLYFLSQSLAAYSNLRQQFTDVVEQTQTRYESGSEKVGLETVYQAEITLQKLAITVVELQQARMATLARLAKAMHLPEGVTLDIEVDLSRVSLPYDLPQLIAMIEGCQPRLDKARQAIERDRWSIDLAQRNYFPDVTVGFNWYAIGEGGVSPVADGQDAFAVTAGINLPIYLQKRQAAVREAHWKTAQSQQEFAAAWDTLREEVSTLHAKAVEHQRVLQILDRELLTKAENTFELSVAAFQVNRIGFQQLIDSYENLLRLQLDYYFRRTSYEQAVARIERAVGCAVARRPLTTPPPLGNTR